MVNKSDPYRTEQIAEREANFGRLAPGTKAAVVRKVDDLSARFPRVYAACRKLLQLVGLASPEEVYASFSDSNPRLGLPLVKNLYRPNEETAQPDLFHQAEAGQVDHHNDLTVFVDPTIEQLTPPKEDRTVSLDELLQGLEESLAQFDEELNL